MEILKFIFLIGAFWTFQFAGANNISLYDLNDEVKAQIDTLRSLVNGATQASYTDLNFIYRDINDFGDNTFRQGFINIDTVHEDITAVIALIKDFAQSEGKDISSCLSSREEVIDSLPTDAKVQLRNCVSVQISQAGNKMTTTQFNIDIIVNKVDHLEFEMRMCDGELLCLSPLVQKINLAMGDLPQEIKTEVLKAGEFVKSLEVLIEECAHSHVAGFSATITALLNEIVECANDSI